MFMMFNISDSDSNSGSNHKDNNSSKQSVNDHPDDGLDFQQ